MGGSGIIAIVVVVALAVIAIVLLLRKSPTGSALGSAASAAPAHAAVGKSNLPGQPHAPQFGAPAGPPPTMPAPQALPAVLEKVSCTFNSAVHGAMPPFGTLSCEGGIVVYQATSRVVTKAGGLGEDGSSTLQSLGAIEMGKFRFEIAVSSVQRVDFVRNKAVVHADAGVYEFDGVAACGPLVQPWFTQHGLVG